MAQVGTSEVTALVCAQLSGFLEGKQRKLRGVRKVEEGLDSEAQVT